MKLDKNPETKFDPNFLAKLAFAAAHPGATPEAFDDLPEYLQDRWHRIVDIARTTVIPGASCRPLKDWVIARQIKADDKAAPGSLIIVPDAHNPAPNRAIVVASGFDQVKVGEEIMFEGGRYETRYHSFDLNGERMLAIPRDGILGVIEY